MVFTDIKDLISAKSGFINATLGRKSIGKNMQIEPLSAWKAGNLIGVWGW